LWITVEKRRAERLRVHGAKRKRGLFHIRSREHGRHTKDRSKKNRWQREKSAADAAEASGDQSRE
jgi:hypothetical protein